VDLIAFVEQKLGEMIADESGGSGNEDAFHGCEFNDVAKDIGLRAVEHRSQAAAAGGCD
jgi:hypothetical protein